MTTTYYLFEAFAFLKLVIVTISVTFWYISNVYSNMQLYVHANLAYIIPEFYLYFKFGKSCVSKYIGNVERIM